jgi:hypothetical protein
MHLLLAKVMVVGIEPDTLGLSARYPRDGLAAAIKELNELSATDLWRDAIRLPTDGVFSKFVEQQRQFDSQRPLQNSASGRNLVGGGG